MPASGQIDLRGGKDARDVIFKVVVDGGDCNVQPESKIVSVATGKTADALFNVTTLTSAGRHGLFAQVFQNTQLVQVLPLTLTVR